MRYVVFVKSSFVMFCGVPKPSFCCVNPLPSDWGMPYTPRNGNLTGQTVLTNGFGSCPAHFWTSTFRRWEGDGWTSQDFPGTKIKQNKTNGGCETRRVGASRPHLRLNLSPGTSWRWNNSGTGKESDGRWVISLHFTAGFFSLSTSCRRTIQPSGLWHHKPPGCLVILRNLLKCDEFALQMVLLELLNCWHDATLFGLLRSGKWAQAAPDLWRSLRTLNLPHSLHWIFSCSSPAKTSLRKAWSLPPSFSKTKRSVSVTAWCRSGEQQDARPAAHLSDSLLGILQDVQNVCVFVRCQCHLGELLLKKLSQAIQIFKIDEEDFEFEVLLVNFENLDSLAFSFKLAPHRRVSEEWSLHEAIYIACAVGVLQSNTLGFVRHSFSWFFMFLRAMGENLFVSSTLASPPQPWAPMGAHGPSASTTSTSW